jgi:hypothetical protein
LPPLEEQEEAAANARRLAVIALAKSRAAVDSGELVRPEKDAFAPARRMQETATTATPTTTAPPTPLERAASRRRQAVELFPEGDVPACISSCVEAAVKDVDTDLTMDYWWCMCDRSGCDESTAAEIACAVPSTVEECEDSPSVEQFGLEPWQWTDFGGCEAAFAALSDREALCTDDFSAFGLAGLEGLVEGTALCEMCCGTCQGAGQGCGPLPEMEPCVEQCIADKMEIALEVGVNGKFAEAYATDPAGFDVLPRVFVHPSVLRS